MQVCVCVYKLVCIYMHILPTSGTERIESSKNEYTYPQYLISFFKRKDIYLFEREREEKAEGQADAPLSAEPNAELDLRILRSWHLADQSAPSIWFLNTILK